MTERSDGMPLQNGGISTSSSSKRSKVRGSRISHGSSRLSHLFSKISRRDKKASNSYYAPAEPPFTSTPDMSGEEDGVEVSYVETESEMNDDSEDTIPVVDSANPKGTPSRMLYVDSAILDDSTTTTTASADYSSSSASGNMNIIPEQMIRGNFVACSPTNQQLRQSTTATTATDLTANVVENANFTHRMNLKKLWYIAIAAVQFFLAIVIVFWSLIVVKILYDDFYDDNRSKSSYLCSFIDGIDSWLSLDLSEMFNCNDASSSFFERLHHEAEMIFYEEWLSKLMEEWKEIFDEYYEIFWTNLLKYNDIVWIILDDCKEKFYELFTNIYVKIEQKYFSLLG